jgi:4-amino-4-deoxy-L-arabinose transferase-like glycosyltransferase
MYLESTKVDEKFFNRYTPRILIVGILILVAVFYMATIRSGHDWGGDFSMYIKHTINIVEGEDYQDTNYIYVKDGLSPRSYPPVFPLLLTPVYKLFGLNLTAMKMEIFLFFVLSLAVIYQVLKNKLPSGYLLALIAMVGFNPYFWHFKDSVNSDIPFIFFLYLGINFITRHCTEEGAWKTNPIYPLLAGLIVYMAVGVRTIGLSLVIAVFILDLIHRRKITLFSLILSGVVGLCVLLEKSLFTGDSGQLAHFKVSGAQILNNLIYYPWEFPDILFYGFHEYFILAIALYILALSGFISKVREKITLLEIFPLVYIAVLLLWPFHQDYRYASPLFPLYLYYIFYGIQAFNFSLVPETKRVLLISMISIITFSYLSFYWKADYGPITHGIEKKESVELFEFIKNKTARDDIIVFTKPRVLALYTGRRASYNQSIDDNESFIEFLETLGASYVAVGILDRPIRRELVEKNKARLSKVFSNADFSVYKINQHLESAHIGAGGLKN